MTPLISCDCSYVLKQPANQLVAYLFLKCVDRLDNFLAIPHVMLSAQSLWLGKHATTNEALYLADSRVQHEGQVADA